MHKYPWSNTTKNTRLRKRNGIGGKFLRGEKRNEMNARKEYDIVTKEEIYQLYRRIIFHRVNTRIKETYIRIFEFLP